MENLLKKIENYAKQYNVPIINENGKRVLTKIIEEKKPHHVLEIGTAIGYSALLTVLHGAENISVTSIELDEERADVAREFINASVYKNSIHILVGDAAELLNTVKGPFDFVFIDAAKGQYLQYFKKVLPLLAEDGVIVADNVLFRGYVRSKEKPPRRYKTIVTRLREYIETVTNHSEFETKIYENGDGLAVSYHRGKKIEKT